MNNTRYGPVPPSRRLVVTTGAAGLLSAAVLIVNASKRADLLPSNDLTQLVAPVAQVAAIVFLFGLWQWSRRRTGLAQAAIVTEVVALGLIIGVEFVTNLVFSQVSDAEIDALLAGPLGIALVVASVTFLVASVLLVVAFWGIGPAVNGALVAYGCGATVVSLRAFVPEWLLDIGVAVMAVGVALLAVQMLTRAPAPASRQAAVV